MKSLLLKDYYTLKKNLGVVLLFMLGFCCLMSDDLVTVYCAFYAAMLPVTAIAYDERANWNSLAVSMPYSFRDLALGKYLLGYLLLPPVILVSYVAKLLSHYGRMRRSDRSCVYPADHFPIWLRKGQTGLFVYRHDRSCCGCVVYAAFAFQRFHARFVLSFGAHGDSGCRSRCAESDLYPDFHRHAETKVSLIYGNTAQKNGGANERRV